MSEPPKPTRGRPKTLDRDQVLSMALNAYWSGGPTSVSIAEICDRAGVSKPGLYREFGSDDGVKAAVLDRYHDSVLTPMYEVLATDMPFDDVVQAFISFIAQDRASVGIPPGCLQVFARAVHADLGPLAAARVDALREKTLSKYADLIDRAKNSGNFDPNIPTDVAALFFDAQNGSAMRMQKEGVPDATIKDVVRHAFAGFGKR